MRARAKRGLTLPEIMVSLFLFGLLTSMLLSILTVQRTQAHSNEARMSARKSIQLLFHDLNRNFEKTSAAGIEVSPDSTIFSIQTIERVSANGTRSWSPFLQVYRFQASDRTLLMGKVEVSEISLMHQPTLPAAITTAKLQDAVAYLNSQERFKVMARDIENLAVDLPSSQTVRVRISAQVPSGKYKAERIESERVFFFSSSADL